MVPVRIGLTIWKKSAEEGKYLGFCACEKVVSFPCLLAAKTVCRAGSHAFEIGVPTFNLLNSMYSVEGVVDCVVDDALGDDQRWIKCLKAFEQVGFINFEFHNVGDT